MRLVPPTRNLTHTPERKAPRFSLPGRAVPLLACAACLLALAAAGARAGKPAPSLPALAARLKEADPKDADEALQALLAAGPEGRKVAEAAVKDLLDSRGRAWDDARRRLAARSAIARDKARIAALVQGLDQLAKAGKDVMAFAFNYQEYPVLRGTSSGGWLPGKLYQKGQVLLEGRAEVAVGIYNKFEPQLAEAFGAKLSPKSPGGGGFAQGYLSGSLSESREPLRILEYNLVDPLPAWSQIGGYYAGWHRALTRAQAAYDHARKMAKQLGIDSPAKNHDLPELVLAIAEAFCEDHDAALKHRPADGDQRKLFDAIMRRYVLVLDARRAGQWTKGEQQLLHLLNLYRLAISLPTLVADTRIYAAAKEHSTWMHKNSQVGHGRPDMKMATVFHRCWAQGYKAALVESVSSGSRNAIWSWRADASHHRSLLYPMIYAAGIGQTGRACTFDAGWQVEDKALGELLNAPRGSPGVTWWRVSPVRQEDEPATMPAGRPARGDDE